MIQDENTIALNAQLMHPEIARGGQRLAVELEKICRRASPAEALLAVCMVLPVVAKACGLPKGARDCFEAIRSLESQLAAQGNDIGSQLIVP